MSDPDPDLWAIVLRPLPRDVPVAVRVKRLLKMAASLGLVCVRCRDATVDESGRLEQLVEGLCERVAAQAELLAKQNEKRSSVSLNPLTESD